MAKDVVEYVAGFLFSEAVDSVALVRKQRPDWQRGYWNAIGGHIEAGETPSAAMRREFREETGLDIARWRSVATLRGMSDTAWRVHFFAATIELAEPSPATTTDEEIAWHAVDALPNVIPNLRWLIPLALNPLGIHGPIEYDIAEVTAAADAFFGIDLAR